MGKCWTTGSPRWSGHPQLSDLGGKETHADMLGAPAHGHTLDESISSRDLSHLTGGGCVAAGWDFPGLFGPLLYLDRRRSESAVPIVWNVVTISLAVVSRKK